MTEAEENPIYGDISLSLRRQHGGGGGGVRSIRGAVLVLCVWKWRLTTNRAQALKTDRDKS